MRIAELVRRRARSRWLELLAMTRLLGGAVAVILLSAHRVTDHDAVLVAVVIAWTFLSIGLFTRVPSLQQEPLAWSVDGAVALVLIWVSGDWRSPFYVFGLTALVLPATALPFRRAVAWGITWTAGYFAVAILTERLDEATLRSTVRVETVATHLMVPILIVLALAYSSEVLARLRAERERSLKLAVEAERRRIAWELHDSAKQRVHAAHLVLSAIQDRLDGQNGQLVGHAIGELQAATADMDTSVAELRAPLDGRPVDALLRERALELAPASDAPIDVSGSLPPLPPLVASHSYRIAAEALTNAVRHARASRIEVVMDGGAIVVRDDGVGMPERTRPGSNGLRSMRTRAQTIGAKLRIEPPRKGLGTVVTLELPPATQGAP